MAPSPSRFVTQVTIDSIAECPVLAHPSLTKVFGSNENKFGMTGVPIVAAYAMDKTEAVTVRGTRRRLASS
jgi:hypothetical protein